MAEIGYHSWGLVPLDTNPKVMEPASYLPPMLTVIALDAGASLVFGLKVRPAFLHIHLETTAISAEGHGNGLLRVLTRSGTDDFAELQHDGWEKADEGPYVTWSLTVESSGECIKLFATELPTLIVNHIRFEE